MINKNKAYSSLSLNSSATSFVEMPTPILNSNSSYVQTLAFFNKPNATNSISFSCEPSNSFALGIKDWYSSNKTKLILLTSIKNNLSNSSGEILDLRDISSLLLENSSLKISGAKILRSKLNKSSKILPCEISARNSTFESITTFIYIKPLFFNLSCIDDLTLSENSSASSYVNFDLETIFLNSANFFNLNNNANFTNSDRLIQENLDNLGLNSSSMANVIDVIYIAPLDLSSSNFSSSSTFLIITCRAIPATFTSGNSLLNSFNNSSGTDTVIDAILDDSLTYVNKHNYVYKPFALESFHKVYSSLMLKNDKRSAVFAVLGAILVLIAIVGLIRLTGLNKNGKRREEG